MNVPRLDHGVIGNGRALSLLSPTGSVDWLCLPRFDSPSVFGRLLDEEKGGSFNIEHASGPLKGRMAYLENTNVLRTEFRADGAAWEVIDFAPRRPYGLDVRAPAEIARIVRPLEGAPRVRVVFDPRPDYATVTPTITSQGGGLEVHGGADTFYLLTSVPLEFITNRSEITLHGPQFFVFGCGRNAQPRDLAQVSRDLDDTIQGWRAWSRTCVLPSFAPSAVLRSALALKLHAFEDTGAIVAAATTSIPEAMGTERSWDYRYCWLRDAAFVVEALRRSGHVAEGEKFIDFLRHVAEAGPLQPLYGVGGERDLPERFLTHLAGFGGNGHVRIGNQAAMQQQNDLNGELVLCLSTLLLDPRIVVDRPQSYMPLVERLVEEAIRIAPDADTGIWEFRAQPRHYTFSRAMCWAAVDRGARVAASLGRASLAERWKKIADSEREVVLTKGFTAEKAMFSQSLEGHHADASLLLLPSLGLIDARDPRFLSTLTAYEERLAVGGLMRRYSNIDDFGETTSAFTMCSFWWAEALALAGRIDAAVAVFDRVARYANPLGLFSEDIDPQTGSLLGNFPQAYTHVGLVHAAMTIGAVLDARDGRARAWA